MIRAHRECLRALAVAVAAVVIASGLGIWYYESSTSRSSRGPGVIADGPTFYQALASLNGSTANVSGGPWSIFSVIGIASPEPFSPNVVGYYLMVNLTMNACQADFDGVTLWNGSIPLFDGTFNSGTAPFWQVGYYSNASNEILVTTSVTGEPHVYAPIPFSSDCVRAWSSSFLSDPSAWAQSIEANGSLPVDSSVVGRVAWNNLDRGWIERNQPLAEVYALGPAIFSRTGDVPGGNWETYFMGCGIAGLAGIRPLYAAGVSRSGQWGGALNGTTNCALQDSGAPAADDGFYTLAPYTPSFTNSTTSTWVEIPFQVALAYLNGSIFTYDGWGLADRMLDVELRDSGNQSLAAAPSGCADWVSTLEDCAANPSGWYLVLLSSGGEWQTSFGVTSGGTGWSVPVAAVVSHQVLVLVAPRSWSVGGDQLEFSSLANGTAVTGTWTV